MIDNFNLDDLPAIKLLDKEKLPEVSGIYFAIDNNKKIWYIGKAQNIYKRWINHHRYYQLEKINKQNPILLKWYECENDEYILTQLENKFIEYYFPALNQTKVESKNITPSEISLRKTLAKISKYVIIYGSEKNSEIFGLPTVFLKYGTSSHDPTRIIKQIFDGDNRKGSLRWSYYRRMQRDFVWKTKCNGICIVVGCGYGANYYFQDGEETTLAGISLLNLSLENYHKAITSKNWSQSYHPNIQRYINDPIPLFCSKDSSFNQLNAEAIKEFHQKRTESKLGKGRDRGSQVKVYCEAIGRGKFVITAYQEAIEWFGGYEILGLQKVNYLQTRINNAPKRFKAHKVTVRIPEGDGYRSRSAPISASTNAELEQRLELIKNISPLHQKVKFKRQ